MVKDLSSRAENGQFIVCTVLLFRHPHSNKVINSQKYYTTNTEIYQQCTTFRPELVMVADKHYGVLYQDTYKTSSVKIASKEEALHFVEGQRP